MTRTIALVGSGYMGGGIAQVLALAGARVALADVSAEVAANNYQRLIEESRDFAAAGPDRLWVGDLTYIRTWQGFCYLAFILDAYSRRIVGWQLATHLRTELVLDALEMAGDLRRPLPGALVAHTDRGSQGGFKRSSQHLDRGRCRGDRVGEAAGGSFVLSRVKLLGRPVMRA